MMRNLSVVLLFLTLQLYQKSYSQGITLSFSNAKIETVFKDIQKKSPYRFVYTNEHLENTLPVSFSVQDASIEKVLENCFKDQPLSYSLEEKTIIVRKKENKVVDHFNMKPNITGIVLNEQGEVLEGVTIMIMESKIITTTDYKGFFVLNDTKPTVTLYISCIGYEAQEINLQGKLNVTIRLKRSVSVLDETIVKGYYTTSRRLNTGNVSKLTAVDFEKQPSSNPLQVLEGRIPGIYIKQANGLPGTAFSVSIRGRNSITNGNDPLYIIDGVPFISTSLASSYTSFSTMGGSPLSSINPSDIESIEILKDADATAIYGSRAANGVILITTKKGVPGKSKFDLSLYTGATKVTNQLKLLNTNEYLQVRHEAFKNDLTVPTIANAPDLLLWDTTRNTDWQKMAYGKSGLITDAQASLSGGSATTQYLLGGGFHKESTVYGGDFADKKASVHLNIYNVSPNQKLKINFSASYTAENNHLPFQDITSYILSLPPNAPVPYDNNGNLNWENSFRNPFSYLLDKYKTNTENLIANAQLSYRLLNALEVKTNVGYTKTSLYEIATIPKSSFDPALNPTSGYTDFANADVKTWIIEPQLVYHTKLGNKGNFIFLVGTTFQQSIRQGLTQEANGFSSDVLLENIAAASSLRILSNNYSQYRYNAVFGRLNYELKEKYLLNLTARRDGSSRFGPGKEFANFGAVGAAWVFSKEKIIRKNLSFLSYGKLRASYGITGNDQIPDYGYLSLWTPTSYPYQSMAGITPSRLANTNYGWERNKKLEFAIDLGFIKDRVLLSLSYYRNRADNQLVGLPLPLITGQSSIQANLPALIQNNGTEFELNSVIIKKNHFSWTSSFNLSFPRNRLVAYPNLLVSNFKNIYVVGKSLYVRKLFHSTGVDVQTGIYQFQDVNGNGNGTDYPADLQGLQEVTQKYYGGFQNNFKYKGFKLDFLFQFVKQTGINYISSQFGVPGTFGNQPSYILNRWKAPGDRSSVQKFTQGSTDAYNAYSNAAFLSDVFISDASFIRLRNISLSIDLPENFISRTHLQKTSIYFTAQNLLTVTKFMGIDPENQSSTSIPPLRIMTVGIKFIL